MPVDALDEGAGHGIDCRLVSRDDVEELPVGHLDAEVVEDSPEIRQVDQRVT